MISLNVFWFSKMLCGFFKGFGIEQAINDTEIVFDSDTDYETDETDNNQQRKVKKK